MKRERIVQSVSQSSTVMNIIIVVVVVVFAHMTKKRDRGERKRQT